MEARIASVSSQRGFTKAIDAQAFLARTGLSRGDKAGDGIARAYWYGSIETVHMKVLVFLE